MFRSRAIRQLLVEDIAGIQSTAGRAGSQRELLDRARRRAISVVALDWVAIVVLVVARARGGNIMSFGPTEDTIFALGLLAIAVHSGFRLGQLEKMRAVERALSELEDRSGHRGDSEEGG